MRTLARHRLTILIAVAALLAIVGTAWTGRSQQTFTGALDPGNPDGRGSQALARVLDQQGVAVSVVRSAAALDRSPADASTTIVVTSADHLGASTIHRLVGHQGPAALVVVAPGAELVRDLGLTSYGEAQGPHAPLSAGCPAYDGLSLAVTQADVYPGAGCFRAGGGSVLADPRPGLTFLGAPAALTNDQILDGDNAAVALRLLGQRPHLIWYVPALTDLAGADSVSASSLLPRWLRPAIWLLGAVLVATALWRGRRLGPLAREPLPVAVKAIETTRNLGRLYRASGDRGHAADTLRSSSRARLAERLRLPRNAGSDLVVGAVADRAARPESEISALLGSGAALPATDEQLTALARDLTELDREVSHP